MQGAYEEGVVVSLDSPDLAGRVGGCDAHPVFAGDVLQLGRQPIRAGCVLDRNEVAVEPGEQGAGGELEADCLVLQRTSKQCDYGRPSRAILSVGGISYPSKSPSVLDQHVLKATSSAHEGDLTLPRLANDRVRGFWIAIRAAGPNDNRRSNRDGTGRVSNRVGGHNADFDRDPALLRCMSERGEGCAVKPVACRPVDQNRNDDGAHRRTLAARRRDSKLAKNVAIDLR